MSGPDNQGMSCRLAQAVSEAAERPAEANAAIIAAGLFAIAGSLDRLILFFHELDRQDRAERRKVEMKAKRAAAA